MKNKIVKLTGLVALSAFLWACADGAMPDAPTPPPPPAPTLTAQAVVPGGTADQNISLDTSAGTNSASLTVVSGSGVEIRWDIKGVSTAELTSTPDVLGGAVALEIEKVEKTDKTGTSIGTQFVPVLTSDVTFTIKATAVGAKEDDPVSEVTVTIQVAVTPAPVELAINKFDATPSQVQANGISKLCWDVSPADSKVTIKDESGNYLVPQVLPEEEPAEGELEAKASMVEAEEGETPVEEPVVEIPTFEAVGCVDVTVTKDTKFTLSAMSADGQTLTQDVMVAIAATEFNVVSFTANGQEGTFLMEKPGEVRLSWEVIPEGAIVTIDNGIGEVAVKDTITVSVENTTTYTITASHGDQIASKQVTVNIGTLGGKKEELSVTLSSSASEIFAGEAVKLAWAVKSEDGSALDNASITLNGEPVSGSDVTIKPGATANYVVEVSTENGEARSNSVTVAVRRWNANEVDSKWGSIGVVSDKMVLMGSYSNSSSAIKFGRLVDGIGFEKVSYDFSSDFAKLYFGSYQKDKLGAYGQFPVNALTKDLVSGRIYGATAGGLIYSENNGQSWATVEIFALPKKLSFAIAERKSCKGGVQIGDKSGENSVANIAQICDIIVDGNRVIMGTDIGLIYIDDVDGYMSKRTCIQGLPEKGKCSKQNALALTVVNDMVSFGGAIYAGTEKGVWISTDKGESWVEFNGGDIGSGMAVYTLAIGEKVIYAAGPDGVFASELTVGGANWKKIGDLAKDAGAVYSLAVDGNTVYAGTETGIYISRNAGSYWTNISESMGSSPAVYSVAVNKNNSIVSIYAATGAGAFSSTNQIAIPMMGLPKVEAILPEVSKSAIDSLKAMF